MHWQELASRVLPVLGFVVCITVVAELSDRIGVFAVLADQVAALARGSVLALWLLVVVLAVAATAVLSLDTAAVLLTPVVLALAAQLELDRAMFAYTTVWLANTASIVLPVSNLTNLLALHVLDTTAPGFVLLTWPAALSAVGVTVAALAVLFRGSLAGHYTKGTSAAPHDQLLLGVALPVCVLLGPAFALGVSITYASAAAALLLVLACWIRARHLLSWRLVPWQLVLAVSVLFVAVQIAHDHGLADLLGRAAGRSGTGWIDLLRLAGVAALGANLVNNLPSYLAMEPVASGSPHRVAALLVGVNAGPLITPWASLATLLWAARCRAAGVTVSWPTFGRRGLLVVPLLLLTGTAALVPIFHH